MNRPQAIVEALVAKAAEVLSIEVSDVLSAPGRHGAPHHAEARAACYQVLREANWQLSEIARAFNRDHSTVHHQETKSRRLARVDEEHAYLVTQLRLVIHGDRDAGYAALAERTRAQMWTLDQEIAAATALKAELTSRISRAQRLRGELAAVLGEIAPPITRGRQLQEVAG